MLIIQKFGGSSVSTPEKILAVAEKIKSQKDQGHQIVVVVSAMGSTTEDLLTLAHQISKTPDQRELDMLLSTGERISMALMAMALKSLNCKAISFTGSQSGVMTDSSHNNARIIDVRPIRIREALDRGDVVIVAGFQGVDPVSKEITTLGRGGSDTTAVALASVLGADRCEIYKDVEGVLSWNPKMGGPPPELFKDLDFETAHEMTHWGAQILHNRSVELAQRTNTPLTVMGTSIHKVEKSEITAITESDQVIALGWPSQLTLGHVFSVFLDTWNFQERSSRFLGTFPKDGLTCFLFALPQETNEFFEKSVIAACKKLNIELPIVYKDFGTVAVTGGGFVVPHLVCEVQSRLDVPIHGILATPLSLVFVIDKANLSRVVQSLQALSRE